MRPTLVILAAGAGTRYGGLKQLAPIGPNGETLLEYSAFDARRAGFGRVVLVVHPDAEAAFRERLDSTMATRLPVAYVHQRLDGGDGGSSTRTKPWGTGHAVLAVEAEVDGPFVVVNADDFYGTDPYLSLAHFLARVVGARRLAVVGFRLDETLTEAGAVSRARLDVDDKARLREIVEYPAVWRQGDRILCRDDEGRQGALAGDELVSMNMWGFAPELLPQLRRRFSSFLNRSGRDPESEFRLPEVVQALVHEGLFEVEVLSAAGEWCGITFREDEERARSMIGSMIANGRYPRDLWA